MKTSESSRFLGGHQERSVTRLRCRIVLKCASDDTETDSLSARIVDIHPAVLVGQRRKPAPEA